MPERQTKAVDLGDGDDAGQGQGQQKRARGAGGSSRAQRRPGRPSKLDKVEERLNETFAALALAQSSLVLLTGDERHDAGAQATLEASPALVSAWVKLAETNPRVEKILVRMTEGSAWGEVTVASMTFLLAQAQAYDVIQWMPFVPPAGAPAGDPTDPRQPSESVPPVPPSNGQQPIVGRQPPSSGVDAQQDPAHNIAEAQRRAVEARRAQRGS